MSDMNATVPGNVSYILPFDTAGLVVASVLLIPFAVFGTFSNILTAWVILRSPRLKSTFNLFIVSLCVSDFSSALMSPLALYQRTWGFGVWSISQPVCGIMWGLEHWTSHVTSLHIMCFTVLRFVSVQFPYYFGRIKPHHAKIIISVFWFVTLGTSFVPYYLWSHVIDRSDLRFPPTFPQCIIMGNNKNDMKYIKATFALYVFIPIILATVLSVGIAVVVVQARKRRVRRDIHVVTVHSSGRSAFQKRLRKENRMMFQLSLIVASYILGYLPASGFRFWMFELKVVPFETEKLIWWLDLMQYVCRRFSECLNPVFYIIASSMMLKETKLALGMDVSKQSTRSEM